MRKPEITMSPRAVRAVEEGKELTVMQFDVTANGENIYFGAPPIWWNHFIGLLKKSPDDEVQYWAQAMIDAYRVAAES